MNAGFKYSFERPEPFVRREGRPAPGSLDIIVCGAGYGKTAYLSQLAEDNEGSVCVSLAEYDDSPGRIGELLAGALPMPSDGKTEPYDLAERFAKAAAEAGKLVLVDNADVIHDRAAGALLKLLADMGVRLTFAGRAVPEYLIKPVMNGKARVLGLREMRFTRAETAMLAGKLSDGPDDLCINSLHTYSGGWAIAAAQLAAQGDTPPEEAVHRTLLGQYVRSELLGELDGDLGMFLMMSAFTGCEDSAFAREVFGVTDGGAYMHTLSTLGITDASGELPPVLRDILSVMLPGEKKRMLTERASEYYIAGKRFAEAIKLFDVSGNARGAERILKLYGGKLLANCEFELIGYCGNIIAKSGRPSDPEVLGALAQYHYYSGEPAKMEEDYNLADSMFGKENKYSVYRKLYNGLLRYERKPERYTANVKSALAYLRENSLPLPFLYRRELDTLALITDSENEHDETGSALLTITRFGSLTLKAGDNEVQCRSKKSAELIAYMLENDGRPIAREDMLNMLWHDNMPANAVAMLHNLIYGLRRELTAYGLENIIVYKNKCYILDMSMIRDADSDILAVCRAVDDNDRDKLLSYDSLLGKYWGRYLGNIDSVRADERREYYDKCYVTAALAVAENCRENGAFEREMGFLRSAYAIEPYSEQIVRDMLVCCFAQGQPDKAKKIYDGYAAAIDAEFGILPSKWLKNEFLSGFSGSE